MALTAELAEKLAKLIPLLGSDKEGEVLAAVRAMQRALKTAGTDWHAVAAALGANSSAPLVFTQSHSTHRGPFKDEFRWWQSDARWCMNYSMFITMREREFCTSMAVQKYEPTEAQEKWLRQIKAKLEGRI